MAGILAWGATAILAILRFLWNATRGARLTPWRSPYLRWRLETFTGVKASEIDFKRFFSLMWQERHELARYLRWVAEAETELSAAKKRN
jgi:hypothetical protein